VSPATRGGLSEERAPPTAGVARGDLTLDQTWAAPVGGVASAAATPGGALTAGGAT